MWILVGKSGSSWKTASHESNNSQKWVKTPTFGYYSIGVVVSEGVVLGPWGSGVEFGGADAELLLEEAREVAAVADAYHVAHFLHPVFPFGEVFGGFLQAGELD